MNGDEVRDVRFPNNRYDGYDASQVDDLLRRIAVELDAGRPAGPLIANATFRQGHGRGHVGYEVDAVDWFLDQLRRREDPPVLARMGTDPWRDLPVGNHFTRGRPGNPAEHTAASSLRARRKQAAVWRKQASQYLRDLDQECANAWRDFDQQPGTHLQWMQAGVVHRELRTAEQQTTIASLCSTRSGVLLPRPHNQRGTVSTGGRTFTWKRATGSSPPEMAEIAARRAKERDGHFLALDTPGSRKRRARDSSLKLRELLDETGMPILYTSGKNQELSAGACITFPDERWVRFPVRGTDRRNAIMTAVDKAGNKIARYRLIGKIRKFVFLEDTVEITVHPAQALTEELVLAIAISAPWLSQYFWTTAGGGG